MSADDPFGLWLVPPVTAAEDGRGLAYSTTDFDALPLDDPQPLRWDVELSDGLARREQQVAVIEVSTQEAETRLAAFLRDPGQVSYGLPAAPEANLLQALASLNPTTEYGLSIGIDWAALSANFTAFRDLVNRQILNYVWVDSRLEGILLARTKINWGSDASTFWKPNLSTMQMQAHEHSLELALRSRLENIRTLVKVTRMAVQITLAVTTPIGALQALALAWQFVQEIVLPQLRQMDQQPV